LIDLRATTAQRAAQIGQSIGVQLEMSNPSVMDSQYRNGHQSGWGRFCKRPVSDGWVSK